VYQYKISRGKQGSIDVEVSNLGKCQLTYLPIDRLISVRWGLSPHASSFNLPTASTKLQSVLNFGQNVSWKLLKIYWKSYLLVCYC